MALHAAHAHVAKKHYNLMITDAYICQHRPPPHCVMYIWIYLLHFVLFALTFNYFFCKAAVFQVWWNVTLVLKVDSATYGAIIQFSLSTDDSELSKVLSGFSPLGRISYFFQINSDSDHPPNTASSSPSFTVKLVRPINELITICH